LANKRFLLIYADRSRAHIYTPERDSLLVAGRIRKVNDFTYEYTAPPQISRSFTNLGELSARFQPLAPVHRNLGIGTLLFELREKLFFDNGETVDGMTIRMQTA
jgi:hypothetical protein